MKNDFDVLWELVTKEICYLSVGRCINRIVANFCGLCIFVHSDFSYSRFGFWNLEFMYVVDLEF
jgi:hypothetical protein